MIRPTEKFFLLLFRAKSAALALVRENGWVISAERGLFVLDEGISVQAPDAEPIAWRTQSR
jgi:hypothetical protein